MRDKQIIKDGEGIEYEWASDHIFVKTVGDLAEGRVSMVVDTLKLSRGLFGLPPDNAKIDRILDDLSLLDKKSEPVNRLSGGMKRRVLIAKALVHEPRVLFLDEPTAGVDVELRKDMWALV